MFWNAIKFRKESDDVYLALIEDLANTSLPACIMGLTLVIVEWFAWTVTGDTIYLAAAMAGGSGSAAKILLILIQKRKLVRHENRIKYAVYLEAMHGIATLAVAASVGSVLAAAFSQPEPNLQIVTTALLFGYCSGLVSRIAIRPKIAILALGLAAAPAIYAAITTDSRAHNILAIMFGIFILSAVDTVRHVYLSTVRHITSRLEMAKLARNDPLTGLANRLGLRESYRKVSQTTKNIAVHCLDLDGFKSVNDQFGHAAGDIVLVSVAQRLLALAPASATVARFGGDEFIILQLGISKSIEAELLAEKIVISLSQSIVIDEHTIEIGVSLGLSIGPASMPFDELLRQADEASYLVKRDGGGVAVASASHFISQSERFRTL